MKKVAPNQRIRKVLRDVMNRGNRERFLISEILPKGAELLPQQMLEQEAPEFLERKSYERSNGYGMGRVY